MIHGGLRYLENGEFDLVRESLRERDALLRNAPHMVQPLATVVPIMSVFSGMLNSAASFFRVSTGRLDAVPCRFGSDSASMTGSAGPPDASAAQSSLARGQPSGTGRN